MDSLDAITNSFIVNVNILGLILGVLFGVFVVNKLLGGILLHLGIIPRRLRGLLGIIFAPVLHVDFNHLFFNSIPLVILANFILLQGLLYFYVVTVSLTLSAGLLVWLFAKPGIHVGASAVIAGYFAILVANSYSHPSLLSYILAAVSIYYFGGIFFSIFPGEKRVSWEGHLFGFLSGLACSYVF
jgi:membrane associated rhomboid family serine protease